ncbi:MAG: alpha/beta hydrolase [Clostridia bacterium]|nr:alpha/beta hydrolase [Clostridia bacterium]
MADSRFNEDGLLFEARNYAETMNGEVKDYLAAHRTDMTVEVREGKPLFVTRFDAEEPRGTVTVVHGFTECGEKFSELICSLLRNRWSVLALDQRGHGKSWRDERVTDRSLVHVDRFDDYILDLRAVCDQVLEKMPEPRMLFSHSMGGAVAALFLERYPGVFEKAVFCAPMIACQRMGLPFFTGKLLCRGAGLAGKKTQRAFFSKPYSGKEEFETSCATSRARFDWYEELRAEHEEYRTNGPSYSWTLQALGVSQKILWPGAVEKIGIPILMYTAETDNQVLESAQKMFMKRVKNGTRKTVKGAKHEIYRSTDDVLFPWWHEILGFFAG